MLPVKRCSKCGQLKRLDDFSKDNTKSDGLRSSCKWCQKQQEQQKRKKNKEYQQKYYKKNKHKKNRQVKEYRRKHQTWYAREQLKKTAKKYGLTLEEYDQILEDQNGVCAICGKPETELNRYGSINRLSIDHDHDTDKIRGLLCRRCNRVLGSIETNIELIPQMIAYLIKNKE
jgi:hypothetical protein